MAVRGAVRAALWAATWGIGVAIGVAAGGWLTVVGQSGAPGASSLDLVEDMLVLPALAGLAVIAVYLLGAAVVALVRRRPAREPDSEDQDG